MSIRDHWIFKDCDRKIYDLCYARLKEECDKLDKEGRERAKRRFEREINVVINNGFSCDFYIRKLILEYANSMRRLAVVYGMAAYSYIAYLLGITDINPLLAEYPAEMAFSYRYDRSPYMPINVPYGFNIEITDDYLKPLFGEELVRKEDDYVILGDLTGQDRYCYTYTIYIPLLSDWLTSRANEVVCKSCNVDSAETFMAQKKEICSSFPLAGKVPDNRKEGMRRIVLDFIRNYECVDDAIVQNLDVFAKEIRNDSYESIIRAVAAACGSGVWTSGIKNGKSDFFYTRDDVYKYGMRMFDGKIENAYELMDKVMKGWGKNEKLQNMLEEYRVDIEIRERLKQIKYLVSEGACVQDVLLLRYMIGVNTNR